jgi:hypothetical protein
MFEMQGQMEQYRGEKHTFPQASKGDNCVELRALKAPQKGSAHTIIIIHRIGGREKRLTQV